MKQRFGPARQPAEAVIKGIRRATRRPFSAEEKIRIVLEGLRGEDSIDKTTAPNQLWQTDFTYLKVTGWGWYYLSTVLGDFSRYIVAWKLCPTMQAGDVTATLDVALAAAGFDHGQARHRPRFLSDNGPSHVAADLADWLGSRGMTHIRGAPCHPQRQGKIERWHQTLKNRILLEHAYLPGELEARVAAFVGHHNHLRAHESLNNLPPADVYFGRGGDILRKRARIRHQTLTDRRLRHHAQAAQPLHPDGPEPPLLTVPNRLKSSDDGHARLVDEWVTGIGLRSEDYGTHSLRRTKASLIYKRTGNLRAVQILLGHTKIESTVRYLGVDVEDALTLAEGAEI